MALASAMGPARVFAATYEIVAGSDKRFQPAVLTIETGDTVIWRAQGSTHTVTGQGSDPLCGSDWILSGSTCTRTFNTAGTNFYRCNFHGTFGMTGAVVIVQKVNFAPSVNITNLQPRSTFAAPRSNLVVGYNAEDSDGSIGSVEIFSVTVSNVGTATATNVTNSLIKHTSAAGPFTATLTNPPPGNYRVFAQAIDNLNVLVKTPLTPFTVYTPFTNGLLSLTNNQSSFTINADPGLAYALEASTNLATWTALFTNTNNTTNTTITLTDSNAATFSNRFYRVRLVP
ncbi:MAG: hypothetical protein AB1705_20485 [Verrucomicrobiota bacterium]